MLMTKSISLSSLLGQRVEIEWYEAVALVRVVADHVCDDCAGNAVPELGDVQLAPGGQIAIIGAVETNEPVRRMGQLLQAVLVQSEPPVQLRLLMSQATAPDPAFEGVREFSEALGYFERPDRAGVLSRLYERAVLAPAPFEDILPTLDEIAPLQSEDSPIAFSSNQATPPRWRLRPALFAAGALAIAGVAYWALAIAGPRVDVPAVALKASDAVGTALVAGLSSVSERVGLGRLSPLESYGVAPAALEAADSTSQGVTTTRQAGTPAQSPLIQLFEMGPSDRSEIESLEVSSPVSETAAPDSNATSTDGPDETTYSRADLDVVEPVGVRPQLPRALPANIDKDKITQIELIILPDGTVASVKLIGAPRNIHDAMLLSAAKAWQFQPALKQGRPVQYRKRVWLVLQ